MRGSCLHSRRRWLAGLPVPDLVALFSRWVVFSALSVRDARRRLFPFEATFWLFLNQVLTPGMSCSEVLKGMTAACAMVGGRSPSVNTSAYCQARKRLPARLVMAVMEQVRAALETEVKPEWLWHGHRVKIVDATQLQMEDTAANRRCFGYAHGVTCGFPALKLLAFFSLESGALHDFVISRNRRSEQSLFREVWQRALSAGDVLLADRFYCSFANFARLSRRAISLVVRQNATLSTSLRRVRRLGTHDWLCEWRRGRQRAAGYSPAAWNALPETLAVRQIQYTITAPGARPRKVLLLTTLLDHKAYGPDDFAGLYRRRWEIELYFRHIKTAMGMEHIACKTPQMVRKQVALQLVGYNLIRLLMIEAAQAHRSPHGRISFKGTVDTVRHWAPLLALQNNAKQARGLYGQMLRCIASCIVPNRPGRSEPRAVKRRAKKYEKLTRRRHGFRETFDMDRKNGRSKAGRARLT